MIRYFLPDSLFASFLTSTLGILLLLVHYLLPKYLFAPLNYICSLFATSLSIVLHNSTLVLGHYFLDDGTVTETLDLLGSESFYPIYKHGLMGLNISRLYCFLFIFGTVRGGGGEVRGGDKELPILDIK